ncbi:TRAP transporter small permease [Chelativorans sp. J32]|uniref:TRAP transporter small permease n=1 Tax=Chelativorans sp. J32 TaxID=935840 RepID=UPI000480CB9C|nr:TRAP transporter small permease subunit [Chelativorans sp. J32]
MYFALSYTLRKGVHINVDLISSMLPRNVTNLALGLCYLMAAALVALIIWRVSILTHEAWVTGEATVGLYAWPMWLSTAIVPVAFSILMLRILYLAAAYMITIVIQHPALEAIIAAMREIGEEEAL